MKDLLISASIVIAFWIAITVIAKYSVSEADKKLSAFKQQQHPCEVVFGRQILEFPDCKLLDKESM